MNLGLTRILTEAFPNIIPVPRPVVKLLTIIDFLASSKLRVVFMFRLGNLKYTKLDIKFK
jgi:hypothetical protein